ncbi:D8 [Hyposoter didymator ichnovirus]|nr:D8 [Hyposoter didymator ichnovirus]
MDSSASSTMKLVVPKPEMETEEVRINCKASLVKKPAPATPYRRRNLRAIGKRGAKRTFVTALPARRLKNARKIETNSSRAQSIRIDFSIEMIQPVDLYTEEEKRQATGRLGECLRSILAQISLLEWAAILLGDRNDAL